MSKSAQKDLITAWAEVRERVWDDVAQQAVLEALDRPKREIDEVAWFFTRAKWLAIEHYDDGKDTNGIGGTGRASFATQWVEREGWASLMSRTTPEMAVLAKEKYESMVRAVASVKTPHKPHFDTTRCKRGHEGRTFFVTRRNGTVARGCYDCHNARRRERRQQKAQGQ